MTASANTILVTGASSGIGAAVCRRVASSGTNIVVHGRKISNLEALAANLTERGAAVEIIASDLAEEGAAEQLVSRAVVRFGRLDQIVSNAGFADSAPLGVVGRDVLDRSYHAMAGAFFELATAGLDPLRRSECGRVVAISSFVAHRFASDCLFPATAAAKSSLEAIAKSLAVQLGPAGVTVNCVAPGYTRKDPGAHRAISPELLAQMAGKAATGRISEPDDVAAVVQFLLSRDARQITGQVINVDGGLNIC